MKKTILSMVVAVGLFGAAGSGVALAAPHEIGTLAAANCLGQTMACLNAAIREGRKSGVFDFSGIGGLAVWNEISVKELQAVVNEYCASVKP